MQLARTSLKAVAWSHHLQTTLQSRPGASVAEGATSANLSSTLVSGSGQVANNDPQLFRAAGRSCLLKWPVDRKAALSRDSEWISMWSTTNEVVKQHETFEHCHIYLLPALWFSAPCPPSSNPLAEPGEALVRRLELSQRIIVNGQSSWMNLDDALINYFEWEKHVWECEKMTGNEGKPYVSFKQKFQSFEALSTYCDQVSLLVDVQCLWASGPGKPKHFVFAKRTTLINVRNLRAQHLYQSGQTWPNSGQWSTSLNNQLGATGLTTFQDDSMISMQVSRHLS